MRLRALMVVVLASSCTLLDANGCGLVNVSDGCARLSGTSLPEARYQYSKAKDWEWTGVLLGSPAATPPYDLLAVEVWWAFGGKATNVASAGLRDLALEGNVASCVSCVFARLGCRSGADAGVVCDTLLLAREGTLQVEHVDRQANGSFEGSLSGVLLEEWDEAADQKVEGGVCMRVDDVHWAVP